MPLKRLGRQLLGLVLAFLIMYGGMTPTIRDYFTLPRVQRFPTSTPINLKWDLPKFLAQQVDVEVITHHDVTNKKINTSINDPGWLQLNLKLFGIIPLKNIMVQVVQPVSVVPGGQAIGVLLKTEGVQVIGQAAVIDSSGNKLFLARQAGLHVGDTIIAIDGKKVTSDQDVANLIDEAGHANRKAKIRIKRQKQVFTLNIRPKYCHETGRYRIGVYVRDSTAGVGTLTFIDENRGVFGALGHVVTNSDGRTAIDIDDGEITAATIKGIHQGQRGRPGEKIGVFLENSKFSGIIKKNTNVGIFGTITGKPKGLINHPIDVALAENVHPGPAEIMTVVDGEKVERFKIEIEKVMPYQRLSGKGLVISITDPELIRLTGGIVQGMSGSPIIQDGKLVGAVTHVFINDPTRGFGVLAEWMLEETELVAKNIGGNTLNAPALHIFMSFNHVFKNIL